jgi:hypothetical protein
MKYIAVKLIGFDHWLWFLLSDVVETELHFKGTNGWGKGGALTALHVPKNLIEGRIESDSLQYS